jgi:hypothetical protein
MTITINGTTGIAGVDGSAASPAFKGNDTDTGVFYPSANEVAAAAGGSPVWNAASTFGFKNRIINGAMIVNQRGTQTGSPLSGYTLDRWLFSRTGTGTSTVSQAATTGFGGAYALSVSSAHAAGEVFGVEQRIESANSYDLAGKTVTVQFWANASTSAGSLGSFSVALSYATATDNFASTTAISSTTFTPTSTPALFTAQFSVPSAATTGLKLQFSGGQAGATGTIQFALGSVQLAVGTVATSFDFRSIGTELGLCYRYFALLGTLVGGYTITIGRGMSNGGNSGWRTMIQVPASLRTTPTLTAVNLAGWNVTNSSVAFSSFGTVYLVNGLCLETDINYVSAVGSSNSQVYLQTLSTGGASYLLVSAEL